MIRLRGITWNHPRGYASIKSVSKEFCKKHQDISITWDIRSLKDFGDYPITDLAQKYDLIMLDHPFMGTAAENQVLLPLDEWVPQDYLEDQRKNSVGKSFESYSYRGHQWALAVDAASQVSAYRKDLMEDLNIQPPQKWDEVLTLAGQLPSGKYIGMPLCPTDVYCCFLSLCANIGGNEFFDETDGIPVSIGKKALEFMKNLLPYLYKDSLTMNPIQMLEEMAKGDEIVYIPLIFGYSNYARCNDAKLIYFTDVPTMHSEPSGALLGGVGLAVSAFSQHKQEAVDFATFAASAEVQKTLYFENGGQPGHRGAWLDQILNEKCNQFFTDTLQTLDLSFMRPRIPEYNDFQERAGVVLQNYLKTGKDAAETITYLNELFQTITKKPKGPLDGCLVLDLSHHMSGPLAGQRLGDFGANVIKIESPGFGEWGRTRPIGKKWIGNLNMSLIALNRNKRDLTLNLKTQAGLTIFYELVKQADVVINNFRPEVNKRLKIDYDTLKNLNKRIVYCSITGFGEDGPYEKRPGQDLLVQGLSGVTWNAGRKSDPPIPLGTFVVDSSTGINALSGILAALYHREKTGEGQKVCVNMLSSIMDVQIQEFTNYINSGQLPERAEEPLAHPLMNSPYAIHRTKDGYIALSPVPFDKLADAVECPELKKFTKWEEGQIYRDEIFRITAKTFRKKTTEEWIKQLDAHDVWCGEVKKYDEVAQDPQIKHNGTIKTMHHPKFGMIKVVAAPVQFSSTPVTYRIAPPDLGEHNEEILTELGYTPEQINDLKDNGVIQKSLPKTFKI